MGSYTKVIKEVIEFDGDTIEVTLKPFKRKDMMKMMPYLGEPDSEGNYSLSQENQITMIDKAGDLLKKYFIKLEGMTIEDEPVIVGDNENFNLLFDDFFFVGFLAQVFGLLSGGASVNKETEKKSEGQQQTISQEVTEEELSRSVEEVVTNGSMPSSIVTNPALKGKPESAGQTEEAT